MKRIITIASTKGGVGKTTLTANLAGLLADAGYRVLAVDADIQPTLSTYYPIEKQAEHGLTHLVTQMDIQGCITTTKIEGLDVVVSDDPEGSLENWILHAPDGRVRLRFALRDIEGYDYILIDTQGAVGPLQDLGVLAADVILSPIPPEILSAREFVRGTLAMLERMAPMARMGAPVGPLYGVIYRMDRTVDARRIAEQIRNMAGTATSMEVLETVVPSSVVYREAATLRIPVHRHDSIRRGASPSAREVMEGLTEELTEKMGA